MDLGISLYAYIYTAYTYREICREAKVRRLVVVDISRFTFELSELALGRLENVNYAIVITQRECEQA